MLRKIKDWTNKNAYFLFKDHTPLGVVEKFGKEFKALDVDGKFLGWFTSEKKAIAAITAA